MILDRLLAWLFPVSTPTPTAGHVCPERAGEWVSWGEEFCLLCGAADRETDRRNCVPEFTLCGKEFYYDLAMPAGYATPASVPWRCGKFAGHEPPCLSEDACRLTPTQLGTHRPWAEVGDPHAAMTPAVVAKVQAEAGRADAATRTAAAKLRSKLTKQRKPPKRRQPTRRAKGSRK